MTKLGTSICKKCGKYKNPPMCKCNEIDPEKVIKIEPLLIREGSNKKLTNKHLVKTQGIIAKIIQKAKLLF